MSDIGGAPQTSAWSIGVDFGTAFSKAAAARVISADGAGLREVRPLRIGQAAGWSRPFLAPSAMFLDRSRAHFGPQAVERLIAANLEGRELVRSFKTILGANDFEGALNLFPRATVDPDRMFRLRDLIILYLAYLLALVEAAIAGAAGDAGAINASHLRFTRPGWIPERIAAAHEVMSSLFSQAHLVHQALGGALLDHAGVEYSVARAALDEASSSQSTFAALDGGIYEASAVGLCHYSDPTAPNFLLIVDIGAGTTDVAGLIRAPFGKEVRVVRAGRRTIDVAGDHFDAALVDLLVTKSKLKSNADRSALWRSVVPIVRDLKEELFATGVVQIKFRGLVIGCTARELERWPSFKAAVEEINTLYETCLAELVQAGRRERLGSIGVILAGGGSHVPAIEKAITKQRRLKSGVKLEHLPSVPAWVRQLGPAQEFQSLFSQLSAAFGAAISMPTPVAAPAASDTTRTLSGSGAPKALQTSGSRELGHKG